jgi:hypothetical protein
VDFLNPIISTLLQTQDCSDYLCSESKTMSNPIEQESALTAAFTPEQAPVLWPSTPVAVIPLSHNLEVYAFTTYALLLFFSWIAVALRFITKVCWIGLWWDDYVILLAEASHFCAMGCRQNLMKNRSSLRFIRLWRLRFIFSLKTSQSQRLAS